MTATLVGYPSEPESGALEPVELGEVIIRTDVAQLRALANHLLQAARELEHGANDAEPFSFRDARAERNTPSQIIIARASDLR